MIFNSLNSFLIIPSLVSIILAYFTLKQHRKRLKYSKIPGPPTNGLVKIYCDESK